MINKSTFKDVKLTFSGHETFPLRYGWIKKIFDACIDIEKQGKDLIKDLFSNEEAISILGVGKNMVNSMRYWATNTGVLNYSENKLCVENYAKKLYLDNGFDPWLENYSTLWYLHWKLATTPSLFVYYWFFNYCNLQEFDKNILLNNITELLNELDISCPSTSTIKRDLDCFFSVYATKNNKEKTNEESIESPLTELGLIKLTNYKDTFRVDRIAKSNLSFYTFMFALLMFWKYFSPNSKTLSLEAICYEERSPGRIFLINENAIAEFIQDIESKTNGILEWSETAGLKQLILTKDINFEKEAYKFFERNYK